MSLLFETILIKNKEPQNLEYHTLRYNRSRKEIFNISTSTDLKESIIIPEELDDRLYRCRVTYDTEIRKVEFIPYTPSPIQTLQLVVCNDIEYSYKYEDRTAFARLKEGVTASDILIIKNGRVTDTSIANILFRKENQWYTPDQPLLPGTQRERLLQKKYITKREIKVEDIFDFTSFGLINALRPWEEMTEYPIENIFT